MRAHRIGDPGAIAGSALRRFVRECECAGRRTRGVSMVAKMRSSRVLLTVSSNPDSGIRRSRRRAIEGEAPVSTYQCPGPAGFGNLGGEAETSQGGRVGDGSRRTTGRVEGEIVGTSRRRDLQTHLKYVPRSARTEPEVSDSGGWSSKTHISLRSCHASTASVGASRSRSPFKMSCQ